MSFRGFFDKFSGTNQSLRVVAERHVDPKNLAPDPAYSTQAGCPTSATGGTYTELIVPRGTGSQPAPKSPFATLKGG